MRWVKPTLNSLYGLLGQGPPHPKVAAQVRLEQIRQAMLAALAGKDIDESLRHVARRILYAENLQTLWYLRSDLMLALASHCAETTAQQTVREISLLFEGMLPEASNCRRSLIPR